MADKRKVEIFSADCPLCREAIETVKQNACSSCDVIVLDMKDNEVAQRAKSLGIRSVPSVIINGKLASMDGINLPALREAGLGSPL
jgi:glutaredoxin